jgi:hypothetical protein
MPLDWKQGSPAARHDMVAKLNAIVGCNTVLSLSPAHSPTFIGAAGQLRREENTHFETALGITESTRRLHDEDGLCGAKEWLRRTSLRIPAAGAVFCKEII